VVAVVVAAAVSLALASTGITGAGAQGSARGVTDDSIKVAGLSQAAQFTGPEVEIGAKAAIEANGPINGRTIEFSEVADDKGDSNTNASEIRRLVQQEQVFGIAPILTPVLGPGGEFLEQQKVPTVGWGIAEVFCDKDYLFAFTGCIVPPDSIPTTGSTWGALLSKFLKGEGDPKGAKGKTAAVITEDNDTGKKGNEVIAFQAKKAGFKVTYAESSLPAPPAVVGDYSPFVNDILTSNNGEAPDAVFVVTSFTNVLGTSSGLKDANYEGIITNAVTYDPRLVAPAEGTSVFTQFDLPENTDNANIQEIAQALKDGGAGTTAQPITQGMLAAYFSMDMFIKIAKKAGKNLTPESFAKAGKKFVYEIKDTVGPTKYPKARKQGAPCGLLVQSNGTAYEIKVPYDCYANYNTKTGKKLKY
jgi:ABC-type branched-subunit amino acid transport system substrate-binding protein